MEEYTKEFKIDIPQKQNALKAEIVSFLNSTDGEIYSCGGFNTPTLCVVTKGIKADCNHLIEHTVRNVEHCAPTLASGLLIIKTIKKAKRWELPEN